jgi:hypothetical protein
MESHIICDNCGKDSADVIVYSVIEMSELEKELKKLDWHITDHEQFCPECLILVLEDI